MGLEIHSVCVSLEIGDGEYGRGPKSFMNITARTPEGREGIPLNDDGLEQIFQNSLDMYQKIWESLLTSRCATGIIKREEWETMLNKVRKRFSSIKNLQKGINA